MTLRRALLIVGCLSAPLHAHPGHGADGESQSILHYLLELPHALPWLLLALSAVAVAVLARRRRRRS